MPVSLLSVHFRNLLPSEELLLFARARWSAAQAHAHPALSGGDATLSITQTLQKGAPYEVRLTVAGSSFASVARADHPMLAVESAFAQLGSLRELALLSLRGHRAPDASSGPGVLA